MSYSFSALVIDDDSDARDVIEKFLRCEGLVEVLPGLSSPLGAIEKIELCKPDVIFLDINMPDEDGLSFASRLKEHGIDSLLVFCTAFRSYAIDAFELRPYGFLVKPFGISEVNLLVSKLAAEVEKRKGATVNSLPKEGKGKFSFKTSHGYVFFKQSEILSVSSDQNYCDLTTIQGSVARIKQPLVNIHRYLGYEQFVRVNRSTIVNIEYISEVDRKKKMCVLRSESYEQSFPVSMRNLSDIENIPFLDIF